MIKLIIDLGEGVSGLRLLTCDLGTWDQQCSYQ